MKKLPFLSSGLIFLLLLSCRSTQSLIDGPVLTRDEVAYYIRQIKTDPNNAEGFRKLGIYAIQRGLYHKSDKLLSMAHKLEPENSQTAFYLAMSLEFSGNLSDAFKIYRTYNSLSFTDRYKKKMKSRYKILAQNMLKAETLNLLEGEQHLQSQSVKPNAIAVLPFQFLGDNEQFAPIGNGLSEMIITDLSQVPELELIERLRIRDLMQEMQMQQTGLMSGDFAPRMGKLFSAGQVVCGAYDVFGADRFNMQIELWNLTQNWQEPRKAEDRGDLDYLFKLEKRLVFGMIDQMGIELSPEVADRIKKVPTKNMHAFLQYCMGLELSDSGDLQGAARHFNEAVQADPGFEQAGEELLDTNLRIEMPEEPQRIIDLVEQDPEPVIPEVTIETQINPVAADAGAGDLVASRLENTASSIGAAVVPQTGSDDAGTPEDRSGTREARASDVDLGVGPLPDPPAPPGGAR